MYRKLVIILTSKHRWFSGRMLACHAGGPGSIPGRCKHFFLSCLCKNEQKDTEGLQKQKCAGDGGNRSPYLSHAKRALYHLSYVNLVAHPNGAVVPADEPAVAAARADHLAAGGAVYAGAYLAHAALPALAACFT